MRKGGVARRGLHNDAVRRVGHGDDGGRAVHLPQGVGRWGIIHHWVMRESPAPQAPDRHGAQGRKRSESSRNRSASDLGCSGCGGDRSTPFPQTGRCPCLILPLPPSLSTSLPHPPSLYTRHRPHLVHAAAADGTQRGILEPLLRHLLPLRCHPIGPAVNSGRKTWQANQDGRQ